MSTREQKVKELMAGFHSLKHHTALRSMDTAHAPRVTPSQWGVLMYMEHSGVTTVKGVAQALGITSSAATQLVDGLVANGYVDRAADTKDRRVVVLTLSKKTHVQVQKMKRQMLKKFLQFFDVLSDKEFNQYIALNKKIVDRFQNK